AKYGRIAPLVDRERGIYDASLPRQSDFAACARHKLDEVVSIALVRDRRLGVRRGCPGFLDSPGGIAGSVQRLVILRIRRDIGLRPGLLVAFGLKVSAQRRLLIRGIPTQDPAQVRLPKYDHVVETFPSDRADQPLDVRVLPRRSGCSRLVP